MSFLTEAFKELELIESKDFSLDKKGTEKLKDFIDNDVEIDFIPVVDTNMDDNMEDTANGVHVGMTILGCEVCNTLHYEDPDNIDIDEEKQLVNVGKSCPHCFSTDGFKIIGTVAPYEDITVDVIKDGEDSDEDVEVKVDGKEIEKKEVNESLGSWIAAKRLQKMQKNGPKNGEDLEARKDKMDRLKMRAKAGAVKDNEEKGTKANATQKVLDQVTHDARSAAGKKGQQTQKTNRINKNREDLIKQLGAMDEADLIKKMKNAGFVAESLKLESPYLDTRFDSRKSFYNKARINDENDTLYSYETKVMEMVDGKPVLTVGENLLSQTTLRHIKEWLKQKGFPAESKQQILRDYSPLNVSESLVEKKQKTTDDLTDDDIFSLVYDKLTAGGPQLTKDADGNKTTPRLNLGVGYEVEQVFPGKNKSDIDCIVVKSDNKEDLQKGIDVATYYDCLYEVEELDGRTNDFKYGLFIDYGSGDLEKLLADEGKPFAMKKKGEKLTKDQVYPIKSPLPSQTGLRKNGKLDLSKTKAGDPNKSQILTEADDEEDTTTSAEQGDEGQETTQTDSKTSSNGAQAVVQKLQDADYEQFVKILNSDGKSKAFIDYLKQHYKLGDDAIGTVKKSGASEGKIQCSKLHPTQKNISFKKSILDLIDGSNDSWAKKIIEDPINAFDTPTVTYGGHYIIDGHHRWSKAYAMNGGDCEIKVLNFPAILGVSWEDMLKAVQLAIVASVSNPTLINKVGNDNMLDMLKLAMTKKMLEVMSDNVSTILKNNGRGDTKEAQSDKIADNAIQMQKTSTPVNHAPNREFMPQLDNEGKAEKMLKQAVVDMTSGDSKKNGDAKQESLSIERGVRKLKEAMEDISITTEDQVIKVKATPRADKETIVPPAEEAPVEEEDLPIDDVEEVEDTSAPEDEATDEVTDESENLEDVELEEIDDETAGDLGESYLKRVYDNVSSFKLTDGSIVGNKLILEGIIGFKSGKKAKTSFMLEAKEMTKRGRVRFVGMNESISKNKNAYTLTGKIENKKLMIESFNYNYLGKDSVTGKSKKLYGTIRSKKI